LPQVYATLVEQEGELVSTQGVFFHVVKVFEQLSKHFVFKLLGCTKDFFLLAYLVAKLQILIE